MLCETDHKYLLSFPEHLKLCTVFFLLKNWEKNELYLHCWMDISAFDIAAHPPTVVGGWATNSAILWFWLMYLYDPIHNSFINSGRQDIRQLFTDDFKELYLTSPFWMSTIAHENFRHDEGLYIQLVAHFPPKLEVVHVAKQQLWNKCNVISSHLWRDYK